MARKPKVAICWLGACGGCDETIVDLNEDLLSMARVFDIVLWPIALDFKYEHVANLKDGDIFLSIVSGSVRNSEHEELARLLRKKSQHVVAFGACACFGGSPGLANLRGRDDILSWVYRDAPTVVNPKRNTPQVKVVEEGKELGLPELLEIVRPLSHIIEVDYFLPGCPPAPELVGEMFNVLLSGDLPARGATLAPASALCSVCERNQTKPERLEITELKRIHEVEADPEKCFLTQGIICLGPATRSGCGCVCIDINVPCRGCMGPVEGLGDMGSKYLSSIATLIAADNDEGLRSILEGIPDPTGYLWRFTLASSLLKKRR
jgi:F420-non-reducing hydrogenase small subunit